RISVTKRRQNAGSTSGATVRRPRTTTNPTQYPARVIGARPARPVHTEGGVPGVRRGSVRPMPVASLERGPRGRHTPRVACRGHGVAPSGQYPSGHWSEAREAGTHRGWRAVGTAWLRPANARRVVIWGWARRGRSAERAA